ncbi:MAG TPA: IPT/TIG domain-containing protein [Bryobacteraceae bacterium]|nr:IPT/TIG domain-containing protein [Bryobacteraceae bacterium]
MNLRQKHSRFFAAATILWGLTAFGQTPDNSQNALLKGTYHFRHIAVQNVDSNYDPSEVTATYGTITFDGAGNYTITGATSLDNTVAGGGQPLNATGTYAIGANGLGYIANPLYPTDAYDYLYGAVSQGVFIGSATEAEDEGYILNDLFIAIPAGSNPTSASFTTAYQTGLIDFAGGTAAAIKNALFQLAPNGKGAFGTITLNGQASNQTNPTLSQTVTSATYAFNSDGSATLTVPLPANTSAANALFTGTKTLFESADGNFILGWTSTGYDIFFGVKALTGSASNSTSAGLYFTAGLEDYSGAWGTDSFYGGDYNTGNTAGDAIIHQRLNFPGYYSEDYGAAQQIPVNADGSANDSFFGYSYLFGDGGNAYVAIGTYGYYSLVVGLHSANFSGSGVFLNPIGVFNAASFQPVTASIAPGELITLFGTGLSSTNTSVQGGKAVPTTLGGVSVTMDGTPAPVFAVSSTQISVIAPYALASNTSYLANIQVTNNGVKSNVVQVNLTDVAPGAFSQTANGIGLAAALHATTGQLVTKANPAQPGEYISLYLTGLGTISPTITDGAIGPSNPLSTADINTAGNLTVYFNDETSGSYGNAGTIQYAGLAPGLAALYQINVQVPSSGLTAGDVVTAEFVTDYADFNQIVIPYGTSSRVAAQPARSGLASRYHSVRGRKQSVASRKSRVPADAPRYRQ